MGIQLQVPVIGHPRDRAPITWQIGALRTNHDPEFGYRYDYDNNDNEDDDDDDNNNKMNVSWLYQFLITVIC